MGFPNKSKILLGLTVLALVLRLATLLVVMHHPPSTDSQDYQRLAVGLVEGKGYADAQGQPTAYRPPLYSAFLAALYAATGTQSPLLPILIQILFSSATVGVLYALCRAVGGDERAALLAAGLFAVSPHAAYFSCLLLTETLFGSLILTALWLLFRASNRAVFTSSILVGLATLCRPTGCIFWLGGLAWLIFLHLRRRPRAAPIGLFLLGFLLVVMPWTVRNHHVSGHWTFVSTNGGKNILRGLNDRWLRSVGYRGMEFDDTAYDSLPEWERETAQMQLAHSIIEEHPRYVAKVTLWKWLHFFSPLPSRDYPGAVRWVSLAYSLPIFLLGFLAFFRTLRPEMRALFGMILAFSVAHALIFTNLRFRVPVVDPLLALAAAVGFSAWIAERPASAISRRR